MRSAAGAYEAGGGGGGSSQCRVVGRDAGSARLATARRRTLVAVALFAAVVVVAACALYSSAPWRAADARPSQPVGRFAEDPSLRFVAAMFRHGDRSPIFKYKTDPLADAFPEEKGDLTKKGKQHMYKKGQIFRRLYNGFLSDLYLDSEIIIKTTNVRRTHMSAAMVLAGLYPPINYQKWSDLETVWQPIPIYHDSLDDTANRPGICPAYDSLKKKIYPLVVDSFDDNITAPLFSYLSEKCGQPITRENAFFLYDAFKCQEYANLQLPEWLKPNYYQTITSIFESNQASEIKYGNLRRQKLTIGRLLREIVSEMELRSNGSESQNNLRKMNLYSGHDVGVGNIMGFMKTFIENIDYGASVHFHLHFDERIGYTVKVFYFERWDDENGREVSIPKCGDYCQLQEFINLVRDNFDRKWEEECQIVEE